MNVFHLNCTNCFLYHRMDPIYVNYLYLYQEQVPSTEASMFCTVAQTGQTKLLLSFYDNWRLPQVLLCLDWEGEVRGSCSCNMQLHHQMSLNSTPWTFKLSPIFTVRRRLPGYCLPLLSFNCLLSILFEFHNLQARKLIEFSDRNWSNSNNDQSHIITMFHCGVVNPPVPCVCWRAERALCSRGPDIYTLARVFCLWCRKVKKTPEEGCGNAAMLCSFAVWLKGKEVFCWFSCFHSYAPLSH